MSDYKRLTERRGNLIVDNCKNCENVSNPMGCTNNCCYEVMKKRLAELEDKIEQGKMLELPCKVGDTVYSNKRIMFEPVIVKVITTHQSMNLPISYTVFATAKDGYGIYLSSDNFNEDWFLTKAEAEKKREELRQKK